MTIEWKNSTRVLADSAFCLERYRIYKIGWNFKLSYTKHKNGLTFDFRTVSFEAKIEWTNSTHTSRTSNSAHSETIENVHNHF